MRVRPKIVVQEDNAPAHASKYQAEVFSMWGIIKLLWPGNSPDLNAIEPCWFWKKRQTSKHGVASGVGQMRKDRIECWERLTVKSGYIQRSLYRIPVFIKIIPVKLFVSYVVSRD